MSEATTFNCKWVIFSYGKWCNYTVKNVLLHLQYLQTNTLHVFCVLLLYTYLCTISSYRHNQFYCRKAQMPSFPTWQVSSACTGEMQDAPWRISSVHRWISPSQVCIYTFWKFSRRQSRKGRSLKRGLWLGCPFPTYAELSFRWMNFIMRENRSHLRICKDEEHEMHTYLYIIFLKPLLHFLFPHALTFEKEKLENGHDVDQWSSRLG